MAKPIGTKVFEQLCRSLTGTAWSESKGLSDTKAIGKWLRSQGISPKALRRTKGRPASQSPKAPAALIKTTYDIESYGSVRRGKPTVCIIIKRKEGRVRIELYAQRGPETTHVVKIWPSRVVNPPYYQPIPGVWIDFETKGRPQTDERKKAIVGCIHDALDGVVERAYIEQAIKLVPEAIKRLDIAGRLPAKKVRA